MKDWIKELKKRRPCREALAWAKAYDSLEEAWQSCERGDWMLWYAGMLSGEPKSDARRKLVLVACQCARLMLKYVKAGENRPLKAIETAEAWARRENNISLQQDVRDAAAYAANAAANAAYAAYAANAANAAANAANAANASNAAANAAYAANAATMKDCADIVRKYYPDAPQKD